VAHVRVSLPTGTEYHITDEQLLVVVHCRNCGKNPLVSIRTVVAGWCPYCDHSLVYVGRVNEPVLAEDIEDRAGASSYDHAVHICVYPYHVQESPTFELEGKVTAWQS
jgi:DNA-directed RNA polymerase subunit RPC12/RpoP